MELLQLLGDFVPQTPYRGSARGPHWGTYVTQTPCTSRPPTIQYRFTPLLQIYRWCLCSARMKPVFSNSLPKLRTQTTWWSTFYCRLGPFHYLPGCHKRLTE